MPAESMRLKASLAEARRLDPKFTVKSMIEHMPNWPAVFEGVREGRAAGGVTARSERRHAFPRFASPPVRDAPRGRVAYVGSRHSGQWSLSTHVSVRGRDPLCPLNVDSGRRLRANSGLWSL